MAKYDALERFLAGLPRDENHRFTFNQLEEVLGSALPQSARKYQAWWANQLGAGHVQSHAWLNAAFHTRDLDLKQSAVTFAAARRPRDPFRRRSAAGLTIAEAKRGLALHFGVSPERIEIVVKA